MYSCTHALRGLAGRLRAARLFVPPFACLLFLGACTAGREPGELDLVIPSVEDFVQWGLLPLGESRAEIAGNLGAPDSLDAVVVPNRHLPGVQDTLFTMFYPDLTIGIHRPGGGHDLLSAIEVTENRYLRYPEIGIGAMEERLLAALGPPDADVAGVLTFSCRICMGAEGWVDVTIRNDRVERIRFNYYVD